MNTIKLLTSTLLIISTLITPTTALSKEDNNFSDELAVNTLDFNHDVRGAYLIEASTATPLFAKDETEENSIASVTKVMTLLLVMEALDAKYFNLEDKVIISKNAASMGGSQVFLEEGETITVEELVKCTVISSANDASVALAELVSGSEDAFVQKMNEKAQQLGLVNTFFENTTGLDDTTVNHHSCAKDIAVISKELIKYDLILKYSSIWQDSIRNGDMVLTNTNRLIRYYDGCNGLKTGSTDKAGFCITVTAKRGNMQLIAVILGAKTKDERNAAARELLDYGFANYSLYESGGDFLENVSVYGSTRDTLPLYTKKFSKVINKSDLGKIEAVYDIPEYITAPVKANDTVGTVSYKIGDEIIGKSDIYIDEDAYKINLFRVIIRILGKIIAGK